MITHLKRVALLILSPHFLFAEQPGLSQFTTLRTIAGLSQQEDGNFWLPSYEGANPRSVELSNPHDCGTDVYGRVYIVDKESHSVLRVSADGSTLTTVAGTHQEGNGADVKTTATEVALNNPNGLHVLADGTFYILDTGNRKIRRVSKDGICTTAVTHALGFGAGRGLWVSEDERTIYFCGAFNSTNQDVMRATDDGTTSTFATIPSGNRGLGNLAVAPDGSLGITSVGDHRVYRVRWANDTPTIIAGDGTTAGEALDGTPATSAPLNRVRGIAFMPDGSFFLATQKGGDVWWVDLDGNIHRFVSGSDSGNDTGGDGLPWSSAGDKISEPRAINLATNGDLLITSNDRGIIRAVTTNCRPAAAQLIADKNDEGQVQLTFKGAYQARYILESSPNLTADSWQEAAIFVTLAPTTQSIPLPLDSSPRYWRLRVPTQAGGQ